MRDAFIDAPDSEMKIKVRPCPLTDVNQKLAASVTYEYASQDSICVYIKEGGTLNCKVTVADLRKASLAQWVPFFESGGFPSVIVGVVPFKLFATVWDLPDPYHQKVTPCQSNSTNDEIAKNWRL